MKSIKASVWLRVAVAICAMVLCCAVVNLSIAQIRGADGDMLRANDLLEKAQSAETAHYKWLTNLSNAVYEGTEFTGSVDYTSCALGEWLYDDSQQQDAFTEGLRQELEPLHRTIHESATYVLDLQKRDPKAATEYFHNTIQPNVVQLIEGLDEIVAHSEQISTQSTAAMNGAIMAMQVLTAGFFVLALLCLLWLVQFVIQQVVKPILSITQASQVLQEGYLEFHLDYTSQNELGQMAECLKDSMGRIETYVSDVNRILEELSRGNFHVAPSVPYIGSFASMETSIHALTTQLSDTMGSISNVTNQVSGSAGQLSTSAQNLARGSVDQADAIENMQEVLKRLSDAASKNAELATQIQENAQRTGQQVTQSDTQMQSMVDAMKDIQDSAHKIGDIIATIESISFQTNILALNAAVEAARAGAAGKGFAVVAEEVRNLAGQSDHAAKASKELIENSMQAVERGNQIVQEVSKTLKDSLKLVTTSTQEMEQITTAVQGEAQEIASAADGVNRIASVVHTNSATSQEAAAVSEELFAQAMVLQNEVAKFQLKGK